MQAFSWGSGREVLAANDWLVARRKDPEANSGCPGFDMGNIVEE